MPVCKQQPTVQNWKFVHENQSKLKVAKIIFHDCISLVAIHFIVYNSLPTNFVVLLLFSRGSTWYIDPERQEMCILFKNRGKLNA